MFNTLSLETLKRYTPSIFTEESSGRTSDKYKHISTAKVIAGLMEEGFLPTWATQCRSRISTKSAYTKHMLRFRHINARPVIDGLYPEIVLINSHDGLSSYRLMSGVYRIVCGNGLIAGNTYDEMRIRHQGDVVGEVIEGTYTVINNAQQMIEQASQMKMIQLNQSEKLFLAKAAHTIRFDDKKPGSMFEPEKFLRAKRVEDMNMSDLFTVFNVIQENVIKGGVTGYTRNERGNYKRATTRAIKSIDQNTQLNKALWTLAERMMEIKN